MLLSTFQTVLEVEKVFLFQMEVVLFRLVS